MGVLKITGALNATLRNLCGRATRETMKYLCVAEKNDAAKNIASILSRGASTRREGMSPYNKIYEFDCQLRGQPARMVMTSVSGHMLNYAFDGAYKSWKSCHPLALFDAPVRKVCPDDYQKIKKTLEREVRSCNGLIIWTDCDREGENIGFEIVKVCTDVKPGLRVQRAKFSEITGQSIFRALNNLGEPNRNVSDAVDVRQELDLRTGAAFTRLQTLRLQKVFPAALADKLISYGSCQFPTLGFVVERYQAIEDFIAEQFWRIKMNHTVKDLTTDFAWQRERLFEKNAVEAILDICQENPTATVEKVESKPKNKWRPLPLDTVEMEKNISKKLKINAKEVMRIAEKLYTQGLISYPRTETNIFPKELNLVPLVEQQRNDNRWGAFAGRILNEGGPNPRRGKKSDQAHPPIHPTKYADNLEGNEQRVYEFIVRHFLACVSKDAVGHETVVVADIAGEKFTAKGLIVLERNYLEVYVYERWNAKEINHYEVGDTFTPSELDIVESSTTAPKLLTEADLIALMEKHGIGTDATHAEHIETIKSRAYVGLHDNMYFVPATLGMGLVEGYNNIGLQISLAKPTLRADFENDLKEICEGRKVAETVRSEQIQKYKEVFRTVAEKMRLIDDSLANRLNDRPQDYVEEPVAMADHRPVLKCPKCGSDMVLKDRRNGPGKYLSCTRYPDCKNAVWFPGGAASIEVMDETCRFCGPDVKKLKIKFKQNPFLGEPNPNVLCIGGCDPAVLTALDIQLSCVKKQTNAQTRNNTPSTQSNRPSTNASQTRNNSARPSNNDGATFNNSNSRNNTSFNSTGNGNNSTRPSNNGWNGGNDSGYLGGSSRNNQSGVTLLPGPSGVNRNSSFNRTGSGNAQNDEEEIVCHCDKPALQLTVRKEGPNQGRKFYKCPDGSCQFFLWAVDGNNTTTNAGFTNGPTEPDEDGDDVIKCNCYMTATRRIVSKEGPNKGRPFYSCPKPMGQNCSFFKWADEDNNGGGGGGGWGGGGGGGGGRGGRGGGRGGARGRGNKRPARDPNQPKAKRKCGKCAEEGHTKNRCPN